MKTISRTSNLIKHRRLFHFLAITLASNAIPYDVVRVKMFIGPISHEPTVILKPSTHWELLFDLSICLTVLRMIVRSKMNERLSDMTAYRMSSNVSALSREQKMQKTSNSIYINQYPIKATTKSLEYQEREIGRGVVAFLLFYIHKFGFIQMKQRFCN
jgi:hypothetical protein